MLLVDEETAASRLGRRAEDRIEREGAAFRDSVQEGFRAVAARFPARIVLLDGGEPRDSIAALVREQLAVRTV